MTSKQRIYARIFAFTIFIFLLSSWMCPLVIWAADDNAPVQSWWQALLMPVLTAVGIFVASFLAAGLIKLTRLIEAKWDIDIPDAFEKIMVEKAKWAVGWAEEKAEKRLLHGDGRKTAGAEKLASVVNLLLEFAEKQGFGETWTRDKVEMLAEGVLHLNRGAIVGSDGERGKKLEEKKKEVV